MNIRKNKILISLLIGVTVFLGFFACDLWSQFRNQRDGVEFSISKGNKPGVINTTITNVSNSRLSIGKLTKGPGFKSASLKINNKNVYQNSFMDNMSVSRSPIPICEEIVLMPGEEINSRIHVAMKDTWKFFVRLNVSFTPCEFKMSPKDQNMETKELKIRPYLSNTLTLGAGWLEKASRLDRIKSGRTGIKY